MKEEKTSSSKMNRIIKLAAWTLAALFFITIVGASVAENNVKECRDVSIKIDHHKGFFFIDENDADKAIKNFCGGLVYGKTFSTIDFGDIEKKLEQNPFISNAEIFSGVNGTLYVEIEQRVPVVRVVNRSGVSFYLDSNGEKIPLSPKFTARVVVATGDIDPEIQADLMKLIKFISSDNFWKAQFEQIHVTADHEFELIPKLGNHYIWLGIADELEEKIKRLMIFYKEVLKNFSGDNYRIVNLKYKDQIVCTKM